MLPRAYSHTRPHGCRWGESAKQRDGRQLRFRCDELMFRPTPGVILGAGARGPCGPYRSCHWSGREKIAARGTNLRFGRLGGGLRMEPPPREPPPDVLFRTDPEGLRGCPHLAEPQEPLLRPGARAEAAVELALITMAVAALIGANWGPQPPRDKMFAPDLQHPLQRPHPLLTLALASVSGDPPPAPADRLSPVNDSLPAESDTAVLQDRWRSAGLTGDGRRVDHRWLSTESDVSAPA
jgi:hypothetical protein